MGAIAFGLALFAVIVLAPQAPDAVDPHGQRFALTGQGQRALALFALAAVWWGFEVVPIGVTGLAVGAAQVLLHIRTAKAALGDFLDPGVWFVMGSLLIGTAFARTGLTQRLAYRLLRLFGARTRLIYLGAFATTAALSLAMTHTAAAAVLFSLLMAIYPLYDEGKQPTRFGKGLFIGMAMCANAASVATLLGSARAPVAISLFEQVTGRPVSFLGLSWYLLPFSLVLLLVFWLLMLLLFPPERPAIAGLSERLKAIHGRLGPISKRELVALGIAALTVLGLCVGGVDKSAIVAVGAVALFFSGVLNIDDLEAVPWNILLLLGSATSLGVCLWQTGAARWLAVQGVSALGRTEGLVLGFGVLALLLTNVLVNVATLALLLPVGLLAAPYLGLAPEAVLYTSLCAAGLPLLSVAGAAPNAMACESRQFTGSTFLRAGLPASALALGILALFLFYIWPRMGMPVRVPR